MNGWQGIPLHQFPFFRQQAVNDCGPACLRMVAAYYGVAYDPRLAERRERFSPRGISLAALCDEAEAAGLRCVPLRGGFDEFLAAAAFPCIVHWRGRHFVVVIGYSALAVGVADPSSRIQPLDYQAFRAGWLPGGGGEGVVIQLSPGTKLLAKHGRLLYTLPQE